MDAISAPAARLLTPLLLGRPRTPECASALCIEPLGVWCFRRPHLLSAGSGALRPPRRACCWARAPQAARACMYVLLRGWRRARTDRRAIDGPDARGRQRAPAARSGRAPAASWPDGRLCLGRLIAARGVQRHKEGWMGTHHTSSN